MGVGDFNLSCSLVPCPCTCQVSNPPTPHHRITSQGIVLPSVVFPLACVKVFGRLRKLCVNRLPQAMMAAKRGQTPQQWQLLKSKPDTSWTCVSQTEGSRRQQRWATGCPWLVDRSTHALPEVRDRTLRYARLDCLLLSRSLFEESHFCLSFRPYARPCVGSWSL